MPAFTVSISTPEGRAGEYGETRLVSCGQGWGGEGTLAGRFVPGDGEIVVFDTEVAFDPPFAGCFPLGGAEGAGGSVVWGVGSESYGALGTLSGLSIWIWSEIISRSCFSGYKAQLSSTSSAKAANQATRVGLADAEVMKGGRTGLDRGVDQPAVLLPLHAHTTRVLPVARVRLVHLVQRAESETVRRVRDVLAERPPYALRPGYAPLARSARPLRIDVNGVDACPSRGTIQLSLPARATRARHRVYAG